MLRQFFYLLVLLTLLSTASIGQKIIFEEDFEDNKHGWQLQQSKDFRVEIKDGVLHLEKFEKNAISRGCIWQNQVIPGLNTSKDFSITIYAKSISSDDIVNMIDFQWGEQKRKEGGRIVSDLYQLSMLLNRGEIKLDYFNDRWKYFVRKDIKFIWEKGFRPKELSKYEIVQKDSSLVFRINDQEVLKQFYHPVPGNSIGFQHCLKSALEIDKIIIRQDPDEPKSKVTDSVQKQLPAFSEITRSTDNELKVFPNPFNQRLQVNLQLEAEENVQIVLTDMNGAVLQQHNRQLPAGVQQLQLYADVPSGSYLLKVQIGKKVLTAIVIKQ